MVYGAALEMRFGGNPIEGSNPSLSATPIHVRASSLGSALEPPARGLGRCLISHPGLKDGKQEYLHVAYSFRPTRSDSRM